MHVGKQIRREAFEIVRQRLEHEGQQRAAEATYYQRPSVVKPSDMYMLKDYPSKPPALLQIGYDVPSAEEARPSRFSYSFSRDGQRERYCTMHFILDFHIENQHSVSLWDHVKNAQQHYLAFVGRTA